MGLSTTPELFWYAVHVKSRHEFKTHESFVKAEIENFLPIVERLSRWKDRKKLVKFPLFPGYLFVHIISTYDNKLSVLKKPGVVKLLGKRVGEPTPIPENQVLSLKTAVERKYILDPYPYLKEGQIIRIKNGPFSGIEGILIKKEKQHKLILSVDILQRSVSLQIDTADI